MERLHLTWPPVKMEAVSLTHSLNCNDCLYCRVVVVMSTDRRGGAEATGSVEAKAARLREHCVVY